MRSGFKIILFLLLIQLPVVAQRFNKRDRHTATHNSIQLGFIANKEGNTDLLCKYAPTIGLTFKNIHLDASLNTLEAYNKTRVKEIPYSDTFTKRQYTTVNIGYQINMMEDRKCWVFITPKVGMLYECDIHTSDDQKYYSIINESYSVNFEIDLSIRPKGWNNFGASFCVASMANDFGIRLVKYL